MGKGCSSSEELPQRATAPTLNHQVRCGIGHDPRGFRPTSTGLTPGRGVDGEEAYGLDLRELAGRAQVREHAALVDKTSCRFSTVSGNSRRSTRKYVTFLAQVEHQICKRASPAVSRNSVAGCIEWLIGAPDVAHVTWL